jgi:hypothetical protein
MKNNLWILFISVVVTLSSCITAAQFNNAEDDVYYSPKTSNQKQPVMIPEVDVDEIIKQHPPQYGEPTNRLNDYDNTNPAAAQYYPAYKAYRDSMNQQNPRISTGYIDPDLATQSETEEAERLRRMYGGNSGNWNVGLGWSWWGPTFSIGYGNYNNGYYGYNNGWNCGFYGYNNFYNPYYGYGNGWGYNGFYNPYYSGWGYNSWYSPWYGGGYYNPWYGGGYYNNPWYWNNGNHYDNGNGNSNAGNQPISRPRQAVGGNTPPATSGAPGTASGSRSGMYVAPQPSTTQPATVQPAQGTQQSTSRSGNPTYTPSTPQQSLENVNGRQVYKRPVTPPPAQQPANTAPAYQRPQRSSTSRSSGNSNTTNSTTQPTYSPPARTVTPSGGSRSGGSSGGGSRSGGSSGGSSGGGGRRR